jgi:hypothetical protein
MYNLFAIWCNKQSMFAAAQKVIAGSHLNQAIRDFCLRNVPDSVVFKLSLIDFGMITTVCVRRRSILKLSRLQ